MRKPIARTNAYLLDTHVWIWMVNGEEQIRKSRTLKTVMDASEKGRVGVSVISVWEIGLLVRKGRLSLLDGARHWVRAALSDDNIGLMPISDDIALRCNELPGEFHGDPADRILVATAAVMNLILITRDQRILDYAKNHDFFKTLAI